MKNIWLILFVVWGLPLTIYRSKFRKIVYQTDSWTINIKPYFIKEVRALFGNMYPDNMNYLKFRNFYRFYLFIYLLLFISYLTFGKDNSRGCTAQACSFRDQFGVFTEPDAVIYTFHSQTQAKKHVDEALRILKELE